LFYFDDREWAQFLLGAAKVLGDPFNWYEAGDMSTDEAAETFRLIVQDAPYNLRTCPNPAGGRIFRVDALGKVQELSDAGTWEEPSGDATIPPVPERSGGTPEDQICLAAKNAANTLELVYENLTDSFNEGLDATEAQTALVLGIVALIGAEFAPITFALVTFFSVVFGVLYGVLEFVGADLWTEDFTDALVCILRDCASNDAGVVTFDWDCFETALAKQTTVVPLTFDQLRLFGQIEYILQVIGGVDALNAAGATTAISDDDCSGCACSGTSVNFSVSEQGFTATYGSYLTNIYGTGWYADSVGGNNRILIAGDVPELCGNGIEMGWTFTAGAPTAPAVVVTVTTSTQTKHATFTPVGGSNLVNWDEGGELDFDAGSVQISYIGHIGFGAYLGGFQTGDV